MLCANAQWNVNSVCFMIVVLLFLKTLELILKKLLGTVNFLPQESKGKKETEKIYKNKELNIHFWDKN